ncbi:MAG: NnrU family protein [Methyloligellaceae bacterium]
MLELSVALFVFTLFHGLPSTPLRSWLIARLGRSPFMGLFSALSVVLFAWAWIAYRRAPVETVFWVTPFEVRLLSAALILVCFWLLAAALMGKPRILLTGEQHLGNPDAVKAVLRVTRHPMLWAVGIWAVIHMANNADPPSWLFFGYIALLSFAGTWLIDRRRRRLLGAQWTTLQERTSNIPFYAILVGRNRLVWQEFRWLALFLAVAVWVLIIILHEGLFGMPVFW